MRLFAQSDLPDALQELAHRALGENANPRAVLLRALSDLFVLRTTHSVDELRQFEELALASVGDASEAERLEIARTLCPHPDAPLRLVETLIGFGGPGALLLLAECRRVSTATLRAAIAAGGPAAAAVAHRSDLDAEMVRALVAGGDLDVLLALGANDAAPLARDVFAALIDQGRRHRDFAQMLCRRLPHHPQIAALYLHATPRQRATILAHMKRAAGEEEPLSLDLEAQPTVTVRRIEAAALAHDRDGLVELLAEACHCAPELMAEIVADPEGEPFALAMRAAGVSPDIATRIFLFVDPVISHSYGKVSALARLLATTSQALAARVVAAMNGTLDASRGTHVPVMDQTARPQASRPLSSAAAEARVAMRESTRLRARGR